MDTEPSTKPPERARDAITPDIPGLRTQEGVGTNVAGGSGSSRGFSSSTAGASRRRGDGASSSTAGSTAGSSAAGGLAAGERRAAQGEGQADAGFTFSPASNNTLPGRVRAFIGGNRRKLIIGSGATGVVITGAFVGMTYIAGPGQLIQLAQTLQKTSHSSDTASGNRFGKLFVYYRTGSIGQTRLGFLQRRVFNRTIVQLSDIGIEFQTNGFDHIKSATLDTGKMSERFPQLKGMSRAEARAFLVETFPDTLSESRLANIGSGSDVRGFKFAINIRGSPIAFTRALQKSAVHTLENGEVISAIKLRSIAEFSENPSLFHPIKRAIAKQSQKLSAKVERAAAKAAEEERLANLLKPTEEKVQPARSRLRDRLKDVDPKTVASGALLVTAGLCVVRSSADDAIEVNRGAIVAPAVIQAADKKAGGSQVQSNQDLGSAQVGAIIDGFTDSNGKSIWEGAALQDLADGSAFTGQDLSFEYKQAFSKDTTAQHVKDRIASPTIAGHDIGGILCSKPGIFIQGAAGVALAVGAIITAIPSGGASIAAATAQVTASTAATAGVVYLFQHQFTQILEDKAIFPAVLSGPLGGNLLAYGSREGDNASCRAGGCVALSSQESALLDKQQQTEDQKEFRSKSFFARTFDVNDHQSLGGKLATSVSPNLSQNVANMAHGFMNIGSWLPHAFSVLLPKTHAASKPYDWGFPEFGIPSKILNNPHLQDPYANADAVAVMLDAGDPGGYKDRAQKCFGDEISKDSGVWDVAVKDEVNPNSDDYVDAHCDDLSDENWQRMILFVFDTSTLNAANCFQGSDGSDQSCKNVGYNIAGNSDGATPPGDGTTPISGSTQELAQQILASHNVTAQTNPLSSLEAAADGDKSPAGIDKCGVQHPPVELDPKLLGFILDLSKVDSFTITSLTTGAHVCDSNHYKGMAADFGCDIDIAKADEVGKKYGVSHNYESCSDLVPHWHYSIGGN